jgi:proteasome lid subunit RPN8/RPN11
VKLELSLDIVIPRIIEIGLDELPNEACGVIVPDLERTPDTWVTQLRNRAPSPTNAFAIDVATIHGLVRDKELWADVIIWHTHPGGNIGPSEGDMRTKVEGVNYLVVTLPRGEAVRY